MLPDHKAHRVTDSTPRRAIALEERIELLQELYELAATVNSATGVDEIFQKALLTLKRVLGAPRASILLFDAEGVMRFRAWTGLSEEYRRAVEGHSPWTRSTRSPAPVLIRDVETDESLAGLRAPILREGIRSLGFFPLVHQGQLVGKFMVY